MYRWTGEVGSADDVHLTDFTVLCVSSVRSKLSGRSSGHLTHFLVSISEVRYGVLRQMSMSFFLERLEKCRQLSCSSALLFSSTSRQSQSTGTLESN